MDGLEIKQDHTDRGPIWSGTLSVNGLVRHNTYLDRPDGLVPNRLTRASTNFLRLIKT